MIYDSKKIGRIVFFLFLASAVATLVVYLLSIVQISWPETKSKMVVVEDLSDCACERIVRVAPIARKTDELAKVSSEIINTKDFNKKVLDSLNVEYKESDLDASNFIVRSSYQDETPFFEIWSTDKSANKATEINQKAQQLISEKFGDLYGENGHFRLSTIDPANEIKNSLTVQPFINAGVTFVVTLVAGMIIIGFFLI